MQTVRKQVQKSFLEDSKYNWVLKDALDLRSIQGREIQRKTTGAKGLLQQRTWCFQGTTYSQFDGARVAHGEGNGNPLQCSCLENPRDGGAWWAAVYGVTQSQTWLKWLSSSSRLAHVCEENGRRWYEIAHQGQRLEAAAAKSLQLCPTLCDLIDGSPPGSPVPGILQARTLEWVAIAFSKAWKWKLKVKSLSHVRLFATPWTVAYQAPLSMGFPRQE